MNYIISILSVVVESEILSLLIIILFITLATFFTIYILFLFDIFIDANEQDKNEKLLIYNVEKWI